MADQTDNQTPDTPGDDAQAPHTQAAAETVAPEGTAAPEASSSEAAAPEASAPESSASEAAAPEDGEAAAGQAQAASAQPAVPAEPQEQLSPKERRRRKRSAHRGESSRPQLTPEERQAERVEQRRAKAQHRRTRRAQERAKAAEQRSKTPAPEPLAPVHAAVQGAPKTRLGTVVSDKASKTITVRIDVARRHRRYEKIVRSSSTLHAHDENNEAHVGDLVRVVESRPLSRTKRWRLVDVLERAR